MSSDEESVSSVKLVDIGDIQTLKPKNIIRVNNVTGLQEKLREIKLEFDWVERLEISTNLSDFNDQNDNADRSNAAEQDKAEHDFQREMAFYNQAKIAAEKAITKLKKLNIPTRRPPDYFAEMAKSDEHMTKVREKLLSKRTMLERSEKAREFREQRKHGKKMQQEITQQKRSDKKRMIEALKKSKKGKANISELLGEKQETQQQQRQKNKNPKNNNERNNNQMNQWKKNKNRHKENYKNEKYGYGGKKRGSKFNTADSSSFMPGMGKKASFSRGNKKTFGKGRPRPKSTRRRR